MNKPFPLADTSTPLGVSASPSRILNGLADALGVERPDVSSFDARWEAFDDATRAFFARDDAAFDEAMARFNAAHDLLDRAPTNLAKPWGNQPICPGCNRGKTYSCICDPFFEDEDTPEPRFDPDNGWSRIEL